MNDKKKKTKVKKKRGRKPKPKTAEDLKPKVKKKRGRKPKHSVYKLGNIKNFKPKTTLNKSIIVHLPIKVNECKTEFENFNNNLFSYNPQITIPENNDSSNTIHGSFIDDNMNLKSQQNYSQYHEIEVKSNSNSNSNSKSNSNSNVKTDFFEANNNEQKELEQNKVIMLQDLIQTKTNNYQILHNKNFILNSPFQQKKEWPKSTNIYCYWDSHPFTCTPVSIPTKFVNNKYHLFGCFCSLECAAAYIFKNYSNKYELYSLLHSFYQQKTKIKIASPKLSLNIFGGVLDINQFRKLNKNTSFIHKITIPPFISILPHQKEIKCKQNYKELSYIPINQEKLEKANESLRLKRTKPVLTSNTLEKCMNLKVF